MILLYPFSLQKETGKTIFFDFSDIQILKAPVFQETQNRY